MYDHDLSYYRATLCRVRKILMTHGKADAIKNIDLEILALELILQAETEAPRSAEGGQSGARIPYTTDSNE